MPQSSPDLASLGEIAAEIAHELDNMLAVIKTRAFVARVRRDDAPAALAAIEEQAHAAQALIGDLLALARGDAVATEPVSLKAVVDAARAWMPEAAAVVFEDYTHLSDVVVQVHLRLATRLLFGLFDNARKAAAPRTVRIAISAHRAAGKAVKAIVSNDGPQVLESIRHTLFSPWVKGTQGGSGLGLALASRIARAHGGCIELLDVDQGAAFAIELPAGNAALGS